MQKKWDLRRIAEAVGLRSKKNRSKVNNCEETLKKVMLALDGELSEEEEQIFLMHINCCNHCLEKFNIERSFKEFLTEKIARKPVPTQLIVQIRSRILGD